MFEQVDFETFISRIYNITYTIPSNQIGLFEYYKMLYIRQLKSFDVFDLSDKIKEKRYEIAFCRLEYLPTPLWQKDNDFKICKINLHDGTSMDLIEDKDYWFETIDLDDYEYIIGINFKCLSCNCECEMIKIKGNYGIKITDELSNYMFNVIYSALKTGSNITANGCKDNIEYERTGNYNVKYKSNTSTTNTKTFEKNPNDITSYPFIYSLIAYYKRYFIKLY
jgi:hypothetical protein